MATDAPAETTLPIITSPPTSPPAKRVKMMAEPATIDGAAAPAAPVEAPAPVATPAAIPPTALTIQKLSADARLPTRGSAYAAGYDLYAARATTIPARGKALVDTDIAMAVPLGTYGRIAPRSGLAAKHFIDTGAGVIDADYRGQVRVLLFNHGETDFAVAAGDRVAQLVLEKIVTPEVIEVAQLEESVRGAGGFGSTGGFAAAPSA